MGVTYEWLSAAKQHWLTKYDWRAQEARINSFPNYTMTIENIPVHFIGLFSQKPDAAPVIFMHGWPGSFIEFLPMLERVRAKWSPDEMPFHMVVPSLPGYTLSHALPQDKDWTLEDSVRVMDALMGELGFAKYIAQGGDVGSFLAMQMAVSCEKCVAIELNMMAPRRGARPENLPLENLSPEDKKVVEKAKIWTQTGVAYAITHATRPSTIGHVLSASPLALLAWIGEKFLEWSDEDPSLDDILTNISLYWLTQGFPTSIHPYRVLFSPARKDLPYISKPTGVSDFPGEVIGKVKATAETQANIVLWNRHEGGGHFAALEKPDELLGDVIEFVERVWKDAAKL